METKETEGPARYLYSYMLNVYLMDTMETEEEMTTTLFCTDQEYEYEYYIMYDCMIYILYIFR